MPHGKTNPMSPSLSATGNFFSLYNCYFIHIDGPQEVYSPKEIRLYK